MLLPLQSYNQKPQQWGAADAVQAAVMHNAEKIYGINPDNIVLAMPMWEGAGNRIIDYSKYGNNGTNYGATWAGQSLGFDGVNDYVNAGNTANITVPYSITGWVKIPTGVVSNIRSIVSLGSLSTGFPMFCPQFTNTNKPLVYIDGSTYVYGSTNLGDNLWHHITFIVSGGGDMLGVKIYVDAKEETYSINDGNAPVAQSSIWIGSNLYKGLIDDVRIYNRALTANQVSLMYDRPWGLYEPVSRLVYFFQGGQILSLQNSRHANLARIPTLSLAGTLTVKSVLQNQLANIIKTIGHRTLSPQRTTHGDYAVKPTLSMSATLAIQRTLHDHAANVLTLVLPGGQILTMQSARHLNLARLAQLSGHYQINPQSVLHEQKSGNPTLQLLRRLDVLNAKHINAARMPILIKNVLLAVQRSIHAHLANMPDLARQRLLAVQRAVQQCLTGHPALTSSGAQTLIVANAIHELLTRKPILAYAQIMALLELMAADQSHVQVAADQSHVQVARPVTYH